MRIERRRLPGAILAPFFFSMWLVVAATATAQEGPGDENVVTEAEQLRGIDEITVTAQKRGEALQDVPIAVTAFDSATLDSYKIENFQDLQFNVPNLTFTKTNFTGTNFQIRGIGTSIIAASADAGVGIHVNDVPIQSNRIFEMEYFDIERIEVLRGPQGTLYGRNATGGVVNMITKKPTDEFELWGRFQYGNKDFKRIEGGINLPFVEDKFGARVAGIYVGRKGFTENIFYDDPAAPPGLSKWIDGREMWAVRASVEANPTEDTRIDLILSYFNEDDNRSRITKQLCKRDPTDPRDALLGCLPEGLAFDTVNGQATLGGLLVTDAVLGPLGLTQLGVPDGSLNSVNPPDLRKTALDFEPIYAANEFLATMEIEQDWRDYRFTLLGGFQSTGVFSQSDYNFAVASDATVPTAVIQGGFPNVSAFYPELAIGGMLPQSAVDPSFTGVVGGNVQSFSSRIDAYDESEISASQWTVEGRVASDYDGPFNFLLAGFYMNYDTSSSYKVISNSLDYFSLFGSGVDGVGLASPYFNSLTPFFKLETWAIFGELYYDLTDTISLTGGFRWNNDTKTLHDQQWLFTAPVALGSADAKQALNAVVPLRKDSAEFGEPTGRFVIDWKPGALGNITDDTLLYASYSRGYKGGGINPPIDPTLFTGTPQVFEPEFINAVEVGTKNTFLDNRLLANVTGFFYDYDGLQVSKIVNRTSVNENIDARIWGIELETLAEPIERLRLNFALGWLGSSIGDSESIDTRDPTNGAPTSEVQLIQDFQAANCIIELNGMPAPIPGGLASSCGGLQTVVDGIAPGYVVSDGRAANLEGNELQNAPDITVRFGAEYTVLLKNYELTPRIDYYWQSQMWGRIFNGPADKIDAWGVLNMQLNFQPDSSRWFARFFIQNVLDDDNVTGMYVTDPASGLFTNVFVNNPRLYGFMIGANFGG